MRTFASVAVLALLTACGSVRAQTEPSGMGATSRPVSRETQFRAELDELLRVGTQRPYGLAWSQTSDGEKTSPVASFNQGGTPAAGLILHLAGQLLNEPKYSEAAAQVARGIIFAMEANGRVPAHATLLGGTLAQKELPGSAPKRGPTFAASGFLLLMDKDLSGADSRASSGGVRAANWVIKQQVKPGHFVSSVDVPGQRYPRRVIRLDVPDTRDGVLTMLLVKRVAEGRETSLPTSLARLGAQRGVEQLARLRITDVGKPSRYLWPSACDFDATLVPDIPSLPPAGNLLATRYALQTMLAWYLEVGEPTTFDLIKVSAEAVESRKDTDGKWFSIDDPLGRFAPPSNTGAPTWPKDDFGLSRTLTTVSDLRALGQITFLKLTSRTLPPELAYSAILTGLTDQLPSADLPLSAKQVDAFVLQHPETFGVLEGPEPVDLTHRIKRLWALYLLASWEHRFAPAK